jgi:lysophospholipase L1-like esterase
VSKGNHRLSRNPVLQYELVPQSSDGGSRISTLGLRDREYSALKPQGVLRVLVVGDSIAYGFGVEQSEALSEQLEALLANYDVPEVTRFEVLNLGVTGYNALQVAENLRVRGLPLQPDLIVYVYCLNDPQAYSFELEALRAQLGSAKRGYWDALAQRAARSRLLLLLRYAMATLRDRGPGMPGPDMQWVAIANGRYADYFAELYRDPTALARLQSGIDTIVSAASEADAKLAVAIMPVFVHLDGYRLRTLHAQVSRMFEQRGIPVYDLLPAYTVLMQRAGPVFVYNALHPNAIGHRMAALFLLRRLAQHGLLRNQDRRPPAPDSEFDRVLCGALDAAD